MPPVDPNLSALRHRVRAWPIADLPALPAPAPTELYVWFENTLSRRLRHGVGLAGMPECLLPAKKGLKIVERQYVHNHVHLLAAAKFRCATQVSERIADLYTAALAAGTLAWIGIGPRYAAAWHEIFPKR